MKQDITTKLNPKIALIVYSGGGEDYIETRAIKNGKMGAGAPLSEKTLKKLVSRFEKKEEEKPVKIGGVIPENLVYLSIDGKDHTMVWYTLPGKKMMYFSKNLHIENGEASVPGLVFKATNGSLTVFAYKKYNKEKTQLFQPPFHNCSSTGNVCVGFTKLKMPANPSYIDMMSFYEKLFWGTEFTHNGNAAIDGNINLFWKAIIEQGQPFDESKLLPVKMKLKDLL